MTLDNAIVDALHREFPDAASIYRFGSTAAGNATANSDIDLAFLVDRPVDPLRRFAVQESLAALLHRDVDLVDLAAASTVLRMQVIANAAVLATFDAARRDIFEDYVFSSYARLNEERRGILERIVSEGRVTANDVVLNTAATIERCIARIREEYAGDERNLTNDLRRQDSIILNLQRACEAAIDLAMHVVRVERLGIPQESRDAFTLLKNAGRISPELAARMLAMVGFRNVAVHDYRRLDLAIVRSIVTGHLGDFLDLTRILLGSATE